MTKREACERIVADNNCREVFSREKYLSVMYKIDPNGAEERREFEWPFKCDGKTKEECNALGYGITPDWMEER